MPTSGTMRRSSVRDAYLCLSPSLGSLFPTELVIPLFPQSLLSVYPFTLAFAFFPLILSLFCVLFPSFPIMVSLGIRVDPFGKRFHFHRCSLLSGNCSNCLRWVPSLFSPIVPTLFRVNCSSVAALFRVIVPTLFRVIVPTLFRVILFQPFLG